MKRAWALLAMVAVVLTWGLCWAEMEIIPWKDSIGVLGKPSRSWRVGDIDTLTVNTTLTEPTGGVTADEIADVTREIDLPLGAGIVNYATLGCAPLAAQAEAADGTPGVAVRDGVPAIIWASPLTTVPIESSPVAWTFRLPADYSSGLGFRVMFSTSGHNSAATHAVGWALTNNADATAYSASVEQAYVEHGSAGTEATPQTNNAVATLTPYSSMTLTSAQPWITLEIWPRVRNGLGGDFELKHVQMYYTATQ